MKRYSHQIQELDDPQDADCAQAKWDITPILLHNSLLMEAGSYTMKYKAYKKKEREMLMNGMKRQIDSKLKQRRRRDQTRAT